jgi:hypothetical protein
MSPIEPAPTDTIKAEPVPGSEPVAAPMTEKPGNRGILSRLLHRLKRNKSPV